VQLNLHSIICHPIYYQYKVVGAIYLDHPSSQGAFTPDHQILLGLLCDQAAIALRNSLLLNEIRGNSQKIEKAAENITQLNQELEEQLQHQTEKLKQSRQQLTHASFDPKPSIYPEIIGGNSRSMTKVFDTLSKISHSLASVLIHGESGTGKELIARAIHRESKLSQQGFIPVNCAAIAPRYNRK